ncbi:packaged DNA stabilization protein [Acinetobacter sp. YH12045]|uniref:packaged DNA stabilization protein n=1 Tax=Acinetobacter sp. YH12045 TaxID=2601051 RepID=UPI0015D2BF20|nr:packaged DNA stabilization protein [Acinetobacter sp. YH12045]
MNIIDIPIVGPSYHLKDWSIDCQRTLNLYPQAVESGTAPQVSALLPTEGLTKLFEFVGESQQYAAKVRGLYALNDRVLVVVSMRLVVIQDGQWRDIGYLRGLDKVTFADNGLEVFMTGNDEYGFTGHVYNIADDSLTEILVDDGSTEDGNGFFGASTVTFLDARFIWTVPNTGQIQWSGLLTHETDALSYATAESRSDNLIRVIANNGMLWLIGEKTTEVWISTGDKDAPFVRQSGAYMPTGCIAKDSIVEFGSSLIWLSQTDFGANQVVMTQGYQTVRISNHALESALARYESTEDAYAWSYQREGHAFYVISFPTDRKTWCYDASTQMWHERSWYNTDNSNHEHHRAYCHCYFKGQHLVGDREFPYIYKLDADAETDNGAVIIRERTTPCVSPQGSRLIFDEVELICQVGQDNNTKPTVMLDWSDDRGKTWSNDRITEIANDIGAIGEYEKRVIFRRLGQSFGRVFRVRMTDAGRLIILGAKAKIR